jgi:hypothetical protein
MVAIFGTLVHGGVVPYPFLGRVFQVGFVCFMVNPWFLGGAETRVVVENPQS